MTISSKQRCKKANHKVKTEAEAATAVSQSVQPCDEAVWKLHQQPPTRLKSCCDDAISDSLCREGVELINEVDLQNCMHAPKIYKQAAKHAEQAKKLNEEAKRIQRRKQKCANEDAKRGVKSIGKKIGGPKAAPYNS